MSIQSAYNEWSQTYDSDENFTRDLDRQVMMKTLADRRFHSILEIGCGTGKNTVFLAEIAGRVHALDFSQGMIEKARQKVKAENVTFSLADLTQRWPCEDQAYDLVVCGLVLEHIEHLSFIFSEAFRVLEQGGNFLIDELHPFRQYEGKKARFEKEGNLIEVDAFVHHISDFVSAASHNDLALVTLNEWWHEGDSPGKPPRLVSFVFER
ncbi:MAG TPA: class I SAM-dependent methyltransferase [Anaerolineales bacterium]